MTFSTKHRLSFLAAIVSGCTQGLFVGDVQDGASGFEQPGSGGLKDGGLGASGGAGATAGSGGARRGAAGGAGKGVAGDGAGIGGASSNGGGTASPDAGGTASRDGGTSMPEGGTGGKELPDAATSCAELRALSARGALTSRRTRNVLFTKDRSAVILLLEPQGSTSTSLNDAVAVQLPSGRIVPLEANVTKAESLGSGREFLLTVGSSPSQLVVASVDGATKTISNDVCDYVAAPDGKRIYVVRNCAGEVGVLEAVDTASGTSKVVSSSAIRRNTVVSPQGRWMAFVPAVGTTDAGRPVAGSIQVVDENGQGYALTTPSQAPRPAFLSETLLVYQATTSLRGHVPGSGDTSYLIAEGLDTIMPSFSPQYAPSPDGRWILGADVSSETGPGYDLYAIRVDGSGRQLLATDLFPYFRSERAVYPVAWTSNGQRVVYLATLAGTVTSVPVTGGTPITFRAGFDFGLSPSTNQVALGGGCTQTDGGRTCRLDVYSIDTGTSVVSYEGPDYTGRGSFTPDGRGVIFREGTSETVTRLRYLSIANGETTVLSEVQGSAGSSLGTVSFVAAPWDGYPVDPTSCFTIVDSDGSPAYGTSLVVLPE